MRVPSPLTLSLATVLALASGPRPAPAADFIRADADQSGRLDISDAVGLLGFLFLGDTPPPCLDAADANDSGRVDIADASYILGYLFLGTRPPAPPAGACGADPTADALSCGEFSGCDSPPPASAPGLSRLQASPAKLPRPADGGVFLSAIEFDYADPQGDIALVSIATVPPDGAASVVELVAADLAIAGSSGRARWQAAFGPWSAIGSHLYKVTLLDAEGAASEEASVRVELTTGGTPRLEIASIDPASGGAGTKVTLRGAGLDASPPAATRVSIGGAAAAVTASGPGWLQCFVPEGAVKGPVQVANARGTATAGAAFAVRGELRISAGGAGALVPLEKRRIQAAVTGLADRTLFWFVNGVRGGSEALGTIDGDGVYVAPAVPPAERQVVLRAVAAKDDAVAASLTLELVPVEVQRGAGVVVARTGARLEDDAGLVSLAIAPGALKNDVKSALVSARLLAPSDKLPGIGPDAMPLAVVEVKTPAATTFNPGALLEVVLPVWAAPKTPHAVLVFDGKSFVPTAVVATTTGSGTTVTAMLPSSGIFAIVRLAEAIVVRPPIRFPGPEVKVVEVPVDSIDEGLTLPVRVLGKNFWQSFTRVRAADPNLNQDLEFGPVLVKKDGTELGFTLRIKPMTWLHAGQTLPVSFRIQRVNTSNQVTAEVDTDPAQFVIAGLNELIVAPNAASDIYTIDGLHVDRLVNDSGRFSTVVVEANAVLGIGRRVDSVNTGDGFSHSLSTLDAFEEKLGVLSWVADRGLDRSQVRIFQPENRLVWLDVTGPVRIDGVVVFSGMRGGENAALDLASGPGYARFGGLAGGSLSGGLGGDGGRSSNGVTRNGQYAGNGLPERGVGRGAGGIPVPQLVPAGFGARFDPQLVELDGFVNAGIAAVNPFNPPAGLLGVAKAAANVFMEASNLASTAALEHNPPENIVAGQGGHGGLRGTNAAPELIEDARLVAGSGGGGGGGGGSSAYQATLYGFTIDADDAVGGGGAGGGGSAGTLRITTSSLFTVGPRGRLDAGGGRGGCGEPHRWMGSPGGAGGGGAGGVAKLQATRFLSSGKIDVSGGERGGALLGHSSSPAPGFDGGRVQALNGNARGGFIFYACVCPYYRVGGPTVALAWPTGRKRADITFPFLSGIRGIGSATQVVIFPPLVAESGLLILDDDRHVWFTFLPDFMAPDPAPWFSAMLADLTAVSELWALNTTDITQSPFPPHHYFISGVRGRLDDALATSEVLEFDLSFNYVRTVFSAQTAERLGGAQLGHLKDIDFLSDGRLIGFMTTTNPIVGGLHEIDMAAGTSSLYLHTPDFGTTALRSFSIVRGASDQVLASLGASALHPGIAYYDENGNTARAALAHETISAPGVPGLLRVDGGLAGSNPPAVGFDGLALEDLTYDGQPVTFASPAIGSFAGPAGAGTGLESLVFGGANLTAHCQGGEAGEAAELWKSSDLQPPFAVPTPPADGRGEMRLPARLDEGFNTLWTETSRGGATHDLLRRHVLYIKDANVYPTPLD